MSRLSKIPDAIDTYVGSRIRQRRVMVSMSQSALADKLGITFQQVQKYEKGTNRVGASRLQRIAFVLDVPVSFFFEGSPDSLESHEETPVVGGLFSSREMISLATAFSAIDDPHVRQKILALVRSIQGGAESPPSEGAAHKDL